MVDVFVSYARENQAFAQRIAEGARREGYSVWWDDDLPPHLSYGEVITEKIGMARAVIVVWSREAAASEWVRAEADLARSQKKLVQTSVDDALPPMPFNQIQFASIADWRGETDHPGWNKVRGSLAALSGREGADATAQPRAPTPPRAPPPQAGASRNTATLIGMVVLALLIVGGGLLWLRSAGQPGAEADAPATTAGSAVPVTRDAAPAEAPRPTTALFTQAAVIEDVDGFTNVRSGPSEGFPVVARVNRGDVFTTYPQDGDWWQVRTADSRVGYMARSRIRVIEPDGATAVETAGGPSAAELPLPPAATPAAAPAPSRTRVPRQVFPDSSRRRLTAADLAGLSAAQLRLARNEIFARNGRVFVDPALERHFAAFPWYHPRPGPVRLNAVEQANVRLISAAERK